MSEHWTIEYDSLSYCVVIRFGHGNVINLPCSSAEQMKQLSVEFRKAATFLSYPGPRA